MIKLLFTSLLLLTLASCVVSDMGQMVVCDIKTCRNTNSYVPPGATITDPVSRLLPALTMSFVSGGASDFNAYSASWTKTNNNVTEAETLLLNLTGATNSNITYQYRGQFTSIFSIQGGVAFGFKSENKIGNQVDLTMDFGSGNKMIATIVLSAASYTSALNTSNTTTLQSYVKVYSNNVLVDTSATTNSTLDPSYWDNTQGYKVSGSLIRTSLVTELNFMDESGTGITYDLTPLQATTWGLTGNATYSIKFSADNTNTMSLTLDDIIQQQANGFLQ